MAVLLAGWAWMGAVCQAAPDDAPMRAVVSVVGPRNLSYLPADLIPRIGADREEGLEVQLRHVEGGGLAIKEMISRNADFTVVGFPALMSLKAKGGELVGLVAVSDAPQFVLVVRQALREQVKRIADLKGRIIGVHTSSVNAKTAAQQLIELLLHSDGLQSEDARIISTGQEWDKRRFMLDSGKVDAIVSEEPFASILEEEGKVFFLVNLARPETTGGIAGAHFLHAALATRPDVLAREPEKVRRMVNALRRSLRWIAEHSPEELAERLEIPDAEEEAQVLLSLKKYPRLFSRDGQFTQELIDETNRFFHSANPEAATIRAESLFDPQWVASPLEPPR
ncbi:MAG: ABC transporter substrate-binding protein [Magnetococcales bacterium]|nr:ABC transporter substrate-binding protein [Magnetococcales bacterium]